jgi:hypothetical protein
MPLSSANLVQTKVDSLASGTDATIALDNPTQEGNTVIVEVSTMLIPLQDSGMGSHVPDGFCFDGASAMAVGTRYQQVFRKQVTGGEQSWQFSVTPLTTAWYWRVAEWDGTLEPVSPVEGVSFGTATGTGVVDLSTGTAPAGGNTGRADLVCLAWHMWIRSSNTAQAMTWSGHTNGFGERDALRVTLATQEIGSSWSWLFDAGPGQYETTATVNLASRNAGDQYVALLMVYAATTYEA